MVQPASGSTHSCLVSGSRITYRRYGSQANEPLVLLHCGGGHSGWWSRMLPELERAFDVVTVDLSGHGDSDRRASYRPENWAEEVSVVANALDRGPVTLVGHSMGGLAGIYAAAAYPEAVARLVLIDPPVRHIELRETPVRARVYRDREDAVSRFALRPPGTIADDQVLREIARGGLREVEGGWAWKYDPRASQRFTVEGVATEIAKIRCEVACIYGECSQFVDAETVAYVAGLLGRPVPSEVIPGAYHHVPLDAPLQLAEAICRLPRTQASSRAHA